VSRVFIDNEPSRMLVAALGFREVGVHHRHAKLDGRWRDVVVVEKFLAPIGGEASMPPPPARAPREQILLSLRAADAAVRRQALESARSLVDVYRKPDPELLAAVADAFFAAKAQDAAARARFVELFRAYAAISRDAARALDAALFTRLGNVSITLDLDAFYEATFVVKQILGGDAARAADLEPYRVRLIEWLKEAVELPRTTRGRISPGNLTSLLMTLALAGCDSDEHKTQVAELAAAARERHRVAPPPSVFPPPTSAPPSPPPPPPAVVVAAEPEPKLEPAPESVPKKKRAPRKKKKT
jgi:hypothetical protein